jgi:spore coat polysaccharide biosynthesis predicted glycosyltransferase SpsG
VAGALNPHFDSLAAMAAGRPGWTLHRHADHMARLMAGTDLAIGAGGSSIWERCCLGLPALVAVLAENQAGASRAVAAAGAHRELGRAGDLRPEDYARALDALDAGAMRAMSRAGMALVDGCGCERAAEALMALVGGERGKP